MFIPRKSPLIILLLASLLCVSVGLGAEPKIGTVDMKRVFETFWKTKEAENELQDLRLTIKRKLDAQAAARRSPAAIKQSVEKEEKTLLAREPALRKEIVDEITAFVKQYGAEEGFDLILDSSGESFNQVPVVLHDRHRFDITQAIIEKLNVAKPAGDVSGVSRTEALTTPAPEAPPEPPVAPIAKTTNGGMFTKILWSALALVVGLAALTALVARSRRRA